MLRTKVTSVALGKRKCMNELYEFENSESVLELFKQILSMKLTKHTTCVRFDKIIEHFFY